MGLEHIGPLIEMDQFLAVRRATWGHLAPKRNVSYTGIIRFAVGIYDHGNLNPTPIACELRSANEELDSSPWFYDAIMETLSDWACAGRYAVDPSPEGWPKIEEGGVYEWCGTFRNYTFRGKLRRMTLV